MARQSPIASAPWVPSAPVSVPAPGVAPPAAPPGLATAAPPPPSGPAPALAGRRDPAFTIAERLKKPAGPRVWSREEQIFVEQRSGRCD